MNLTRRAYLGGSVALGLASTLALPTFAQSREATLRHVMGGNVNSLDPTIPGASRESAGLSMSIYDRLIRFGRVKVNDQWVFDQSIIIPELAESVERSADGLKLTFKLRADATWHDGTPVTAEDIKWSLDRMVSAKSLAPSQFQSGSMTIPDQFVIVDPDTIEINLPEANRLALANLGLPYAIMINSKVAKEHATEEDPWALEWLKTNHAGSGAYKVEAFRPGEQVVLVRNESWSGGGEDKALGFERVIIQTVPEPATRANLVERGDADLAVDLQASDLTSLRERGIAKIVSNPQTNGFTHISMNTQIPPFDNVKVRQAIAAALPYEDMFQAALFGRGRKLFGADWTGTPPTSDFPEPMPNRTDLDRARTLLAEAGFPNGFDTTFTFAIGYAAVAEPMAALLKESLAKVGINVTINKVPDAQLSTMQSEKTLPFYVDTGNAWLPETFYFFWVYFTRDQRWNLASWKNTRIEELVALARIETDEAQYEEYCKEMIAIMAEEQPLIMVYQANLDAVMAPTVEGFTYRFHRQVDYRDLERV
ncbi:MAG: ABC transporter substrate-binding protein [Paracoccaceae bacterium]